MLHVHVLRLSGDNVSTLGKMWIEGEPMFRCKTEEKPLQEFAHLQKLKCALPDGDYVGCIKMVGRFCTLGILKGGFYSMARFGDAPLGSMPLGSVRMFSNRADTKELLSEYLFQMMAKGFTSQPRPKRGDIQIHIRTDKDFEYTPREEEKDGYDFNLDDDYV